MSSPIDPSAQSNSGRGGVPSGPSSVQRIRQALSVALDPPAIGRQPPPIPVADHELIQPIGHGAYGDVWLARNALGSWRAVKVIFRARFKEDRPYEREFSGILKFEPISRTHEGFVPILQVGRNDGVGCFYYVMELADAMPDESDPAKLSKPGPRPSSVATKSAFHALRPVASGPLPTSYSPATLRSLLATYGRFSPIDSAQCALRLAGALGHLHSHGLIHRDIKPANVIFIGGAPRLADIGLVTDAGDAQSFVGTDGFIPPEGPGSPGADLYALGKLLYELATGRDRLEFPQLPMAVARGPEGESLLELNEIMTRACAPAPGQRYQAATEFQADLNFFLAGRSLRHARHLEKNLARLKQAAILAAVFLVAAVAIVWIARLGEQQARKRAAELDHQARAEQALRQRAESAEKDAERRLYTALLEQARAGVRSRVVGQRLDALVAIQHAAAISNSVDLRQEVLAALSLPDLRLIEEQNYSDDATALELDPSLQRIALSHGIGPIEIRSKTNNQLLVSLPASTNRPATDIRWADDGHYLAVRREHAGTVDQADIEVWRVEDKQAQQILVAHSVPAGAFAFNPKRPELLIGRAKSQAAVWDLSTGREVRQLSLGSRAIQFRYSPDGESFAMARPFGASCAVTVHHIADGALISTHVFESEVFSLDWNSRNDRLAVADSSGAVHLMNPIDGQARLLGHHKAEAVFVRFRPDGHYLISGGWEREMICWDLETMERAFVASLDSYAMQFSQDGRFCAVKTRRHIGVRRYAFESPEGFLDLKQAGGGRFRHARFSADGHWLAASSDHGLEVWDLQNGGPAAISTVGSDVRPFFTPDGREIFGSRNQAGFRWSLSPATNQNSAPILEPMELRLPAGFVSLCLASSNLVVTTSRGSQIRPWNAPNADGARWMPTASGITVPSPDGHWLAIHRAYNSSLHVYSLPSLEPVARLNHPAAIGGVRFDFSGAKMAVYSSRQADILSTKTWHIERSLRDCSALLPTPNGMGWWISDDARQGSLHGPDFETALLPLPKGTTPLAVSSDGLNLAVSVDARRLLVWDLGRIQSRLTELGLGW